MVRGFKKFRNEYLFLASWIATTFVIFTCAHSKLASYILPLFPAICCALAISVSSLSGKPKVLLPAGIINILLGAAGLIGYPLIAKEYPDMAKPLLICLAVLFVFMAAGGISLIRGKVRLSVWLNIAALSAFLLAGVSSVPAKLETAFCDQALPGVVRQYGYEGKTILCSKIFVRGVSFYTGNPVLVLNFGSKFPFWSRHPVDVICSDEEILAFFRGKDNVLCVLTSEGFVKVKELVGGMTDVKVISQNLDRVVAIGEKPRR
jgi:4-amino-4-deoxy-L-arabinose transferase-like glycosyltransferase